MRLNKSVKAIVRAVAGCSEHCAHARLTMCAVVLARNVGGNATGTRETVKRGKPERLWG